MNPVDGGWERWGSRIKFDTYPFVLGVDGAGVVDEIGKEVKNWKKGDRVYFHNFLKRGQGTFAEYSIIDSRAAVLLPDSMSFVEGAAVPCAGI